ncbi:hypothetical protein CEXT_574531 [Caerostris extrusa]|uniref:Uncharacterized protein n=1 Tax=Caerostris extrusa TaxID=172846 RepID=A0AAV4TAS7_CAEEX|nr:hypothetical protein CEXT_574531 [Caerostris extrusa]
MRTREQRIPARNRIPIQNRISLKATNRIWFILIARARVWVGIVWFGGQKEQPFVAKKSDYNQNKQIAFIRNRNFSHSTRPFFCLLEQTVESHGTQYP